MVGTPLVHNLVSRGKRSLACQARDEPSAWPGGVRTINKGVMDLIRQRNRIAFSDLQNRAQAAHDVDARHGQWHIRLGGEAGRESAAPEVTAIGRMECCCIKARVYFIVGNFPKRLHYRSAIF